MSYVSSLAAGGTTFYFPFADHQWELEAGYTAPIQEWIVPADTAASVMSSIAGLTGAAREVRLRFGDPDSLITVERVIVLGVAPADNVQRRRLLLTDVRWYFTRAWLNMDVNIRRRIGDKRLVGDDLVSQSSVDTIAYAAWSINNGVAYDWDSLKNQVLTYLTTARHGRPDIAFTTDFILTIDPGAKTVQETTTDAPGYVGLARAIESIPGVGLYVDLDGEIHVYDRVPGAEKPTIEQLPPPLMGHGDLVWVDNSGLRPLPTDHSWRIYVDYEVEVRFTYNASGSGLWGSLAARDPFLQPVIQVTDKSLEIPPGSWSATRRIVGQGTWITQEEAFVAWGGVSYGPITLPTLTDTIVANHWFGDALQRYAIGGAIASFDPVWSSRIGELMRCYRTFFRVNPQFWDLVRHAWAVRAAVWDPVTSTRAPSPVYSNYNLMPLDHFDAASVRVFGLDVTTSYSETGLLVAGQPSGFRVSIEDEELGIISIQRDISRFPGHTRIAPSPVVQLASISDDATLLREACLQRLIPAIPTDEGGASWKLAVILSCVPAAPNDLGRMYEVQVSTDEAAEAAGLKGYTGSGYGPDQELRSQLADARIAWRDGSSAAILSMFGADDSGGVISDDGSITTIDPVNLQQELKPLAKAIAAADLLSKQDCYQGSLAVPANENLVPLGSITRVTHRVTENRAVSVIHCSPNPPPFRAVDFLQGTARNFLLKEIASAR